MARLSAQANLGYVPLPDAAAALIASFIRPPDPSVPVCVCDPCAGEGLALARIASALGIPPARRYGCELHDARAAAARDHIDHLLACDALHALQGSRGAFQLAYLNPPFDDATAAEGGGRLELAFCRRVVVEGGWVQPGGLLVLVTPQDVLARPAFVQHLATCYDELAIYRQPDAIRHYREAVVFGVVRARWRIGDERKTVIRELAALLQGMLPELATPDTPPYQLPAPLARRSPLRWRDASQGTPAVAQREVMETGGAWASAAYRAAARQLHSERLLPRFPLHPGQRVFRIAAGEINGRVIPIEGVPHRIKGSTIDEVIEWDEERSTRTAQIAEHKRVTRAVPVISALAPDGSIRQYVGSEGIATLLADPQVAAALADAVTEAAPPTYRLDMEPWLAELLGAIRPPTALPGQTPGVLPMQQHVIAAAVRTLRTLDPAWDRTPQSVIIAAEMGCGKTLMGMLTAHALITALSQDERAAHQRATRTL